jgi:polyhydroxyalkanoate synthesis regulator phasin
MANFVNLLTEPLIETTEKVREQVKTAREGGEELVKDAKEQYKLWINKLEEAYLELLRSPEYTSALTEVLKALRDYKVSRQQLLIDLFQDLPVPTHKDMDELYKELYYLKKRVKELEKRGKKNG